MASGSQPNAAEIDRLALALAKNPASKSFIPLAEEYGKAGMWAEAAGVLEDGLKYYPGFITAMVALGRAYDQLSQPTKAKAILEEAIKISPENLRAHRTLAKIYIAEGSKAAALRSCDAILALNPMDQESLSLRASLDSAPPADARVSAKIPGRTPPSTPQPPTVSTPSDALVKRGAPAAIAAAETVSRATAPSAIDSVADATDLMTAALTTDPALMLSRTTAETPATPDPAETHATPASQRRAIAKRLDQMLQSIQTRRRDRPAPEATASPSQL